MGRITGLVLCTVGVLVFASMVQGQGNRGIPGVDYPNYFTLPETSFSCAKQKYIPGFYADMDTQCQAFHFCYQDRQESFLCPTGTVFNQEILACDPWYNFNCSLAPLFFSKNAGPAMAKAGKNIPMLLKLRSTQGRSKMQTFKKVHGEVSTQSETGKDATIKESKAPESLEKEPSGVPIDVANDVKDFVEESPNYSAENDNIEENIVYDPATEGYYMKYDQYEPGWQPESEPVSDEFSSFYEHENEPQENEEILKGKPVHEFRDEESEIRPHSSDTLELNKVVGEIDETRDFSKRLMQTDLQSKRNRKRPLYVVVPDEENEAEIKLPNRPRRQSSEANATSEELAEQTQNEPFPRPTAIPVHLRENQTERPLSTEEFGQAIFTALVEPYITDDELGSPRYPLIGCSDPPCTQTQQEELTQTPSDETPAQQTGDETPAQQTGDESPAQQADIQNEEPIDDISFQEGYDSDTYGEENVVYHRNIEGAYTNLQSDPYQNAAETSEDSDETFLVIPDELDMPSVVETDQTNADDKNKMYKDDYSQYRSSVESPEAFGSYQFKQQRPQVHGFGNYPEGWRRDYQHYLSTVRDRYYQNQHGYQMNQPAGYEHPYRSPESPYFYDEVYPSSYPQQNGEAGYVSDYSNEYPDPASAVWVPASNEAELSDVVMVTQSPDLDITEASIIDESSSVSELEYEPDDMGSVLSTEGIDQDEEKYYLFDFDDDEVEAEKDESELLERTDAEKSDEPLNSYAELPDLKGSYETVKVEALEVPDSNDTLKDSKSESIGEVSSHSDDFPLEQEKAKSPSELGMEEKTVPDAQRSTTESSSESEEPVTLSSAFERLAALKTKPKSPSLQSFDFSKDQTFINAAFPESMDFGPYGYGTSMGQQYGMVDSTNTKTGSKFSHRTGESELSRLAKLSAIQDRIRSVKQGKFGMFKKYMGSARNL